MRTTLAIDDDVLARAKAIARARHLPLGRVVSNLMRHGLQLTVSERNNFPIVDVPTGAQRITSEAVRQAEDEP